LLSLVLSAGAAFASDRRAEKPYALIFGTVYAPNNHPAYGVRVKIRRADGKKGKWELYSDHQGEFAQRVPAGAADYIVRAEPEGKHAPKAEVTVHVQGDERVDIGLHLSQ
jgi:Carboxypeptidase regulatory-like domain